MNNLHVRPPTPPYSGHFDDLLEKINTMRAELEMFRAERNNSEQGSFRTALASQLVANGHPDVITTFNDVEFLAYVVSSLGGVVL